jgi:hypothetical protein
MADFGKFTTTSYDFASQECEIGIDEAGRGPVLGKHLPHAYHKPLLIRPYGLRMLLLADFGEGLDEG